MSETQSNNKRIAKNTLLLYCRTFIMLIVTLYTSRVTLNALGVEDFGIYNVVGGIVAMFGMISGSLSASISRFITFELGTGNEKKLQRIFSTSINVQLIFSVIVIILAETIGLWFLNNKMVIPLERINAANWVYQLSIITFIINLLSVPYNAAIIAHEKMAAFAYIGIFEAFGKLVIAYFIIISPIDQLVFYSASLTFLAVLIRFTYGFYCKYKFTECSYNFILDKTLLQQIFQFSGWNLIGTSSIVVREQGGNILLNLFGGPTLNAAKVIAMQVNNAASGFVANFMTALNPQITKSYASNNTDYMIKLVFQGARFSYYILFLLALPIILNAEQIILIWLNNVPEHSVLFVQLVLIFTLSDCISSPLITAMLATGNIRNYQLAVGGLQILNLPISFVCLYLGAFPESIMIVSIIISQCCLLVRLYMLKAKVNFSLRAYFKKVYLNILIVSLLSSTIPVIVTFSFNTGMISFIITSVLSLISTTIVIYFIGCDKAERLFLSTKVSAIFDKITIKLRNDKI